MNYADLTAIFADLPRFVHIIGVALGLGGGLIADIRFMRFLFARFDVTDLEFFHDMHRIVSKALVLLWISGLMLLVMRTGFLPENFSPKLITKLLVVGLLTLNAIMVGVLAMPVLTRMIDCQLGELNLTDRLRLTLVGGISSASWLSGLLLGVFAILKRIPSDRLVDIFCGIYAIALVGAVLFALAAPLFVRTSGSVDARAPTRAPARAPMLAYG